MPEPQDSQSPEPELPAGGAAEPGTLTNASIVVVSGGPSGKIFPLLGAELIIGRHAAAHIRIDDKALSSRHARINRTSTGHSLTDLGSTNGTFLNAKRLAANETVDLLPGDSVQIAETVLAYLPAGARSPQEQTQYLSRLNPSMPSALALRAPDGTLPNAQILAQLLTGQMSEPPEPPPPTIEERIHRAKEMLKVVKRNGLILFAGAALGALGGDARVFWKPPLAEATFEIRITPGATNDQMHTYDRDNRGFYTAAAQAFLNQRLVEQTMEGVGFKHPTRQQIDDMTTGLDFDSVAFMTFEGKYSNRDPEFAVKFLRLHLNNFLDSEVAKNIRVVQAEVDFLADRVKERDTELARIEGELSAFKSKHLEGLPEFTGSHMTSREALIARRGDLSAQLTRANLELAAARKRLKEAAPLAAGKVAEAAPYTAALVDVNRKLGEARAKGLGNLHPEVQALAKQKADLERMRDEALKKDSSKLEQDANTGLVELRNRVTDLEVAAKGTGAELGEVNGQLSRIEGIVSTIPETEARYAELTRSYTASKELQAKLFEQLKSAQLKLDLERASARARYEVIDDPASSGVPMRKALLKGTLIGGALGLVLGVLLAAIREGRRWLKARSRHQTNAIVAVAAPPPDWITRR